MAHKVSGVEIYAPKHIFKTTWEGFPEMCKSTKMLECSPRAKQRLQLNNWIDMDEYDTYNEYIPSNISFK